MYLEVAGFSTFPLPAADIIVGQLNQGSANERSTELRTYPNVSCTLSSQLIIKIEKH